MKRVMLSPQVHYHIVLAMSLGQWQDEKTENSLL